LDFQRLVAAMELLTRADLGRKVGGANNQRILRRQVAFVGGAILERALNTGLVKDHHAALDAQTTGRTIMRCGLKRGTGGAPTGLRRRRQADGPAARPAGPATGGLPLP